MDDARPAPRGDLTTKIARLVEEKGWNQEDFAAIPLSPQMSAVSSSSGSAAACARYNRVAKRRAPLKRR